MGVIKEGYWEFRLRAQMLMKIPAEPEHPSD